MTTSTATSRLSVPRRFAPVLALLILSPWVGEFLLGNVPAGLIFAIPFLVPLYGGGALLIRELTRRTGRGWATILVLGLAYGVIEAGLVDQSLFNAGFGGNEFQRLTAIPALGIGAYDVITFIVGHAVWSIAVPIALVEMLTPSRRTTPWLGNAGLVATGALYLVGCWIIFADVHESEGFLASPAQLLGAAVTAFVLIAVAFVLRRPTTPVGDRRVPAPWLLGIATFVVASAFFARPDDWLGGVVAGVVLVAGVSAFVAYWSRQPA